MSDSDLRELERLWQDSQSVEDEAMYMLALMRCALLPEPNAELAAALGNQAAARATARDPSARVDAPLPRNDADLVRRLAGLDAPNRGRACARAAYSIALRCLDRWRHAFLDCTRFYAALEAVRDWTDGLASDAEALAHRLTDTDEDSVLLPETDPRARAAVTCIRTAEGMVGWQSGTALRPLLNSVIEAGRFSLGDTFLGGVQQVQLAIREGLEPWLLGSPGAAP